jgi:hypothetical protein
VHPWLWVAVAVFATSASVDESGVLFGTQRLDASSSFAAYAMLQQLLGSPAAEGSDAQSPTFATAGAGRDAAAGVAVPPADGFGSSDPRFRLVFDPILK